MPTIEVNPTADITVKYLNPPKEEGKSWSIKDQHDNLYFLPDGMNNQFAKGMACKIEYREKGKWKTVTKIIGNGAAPMIPKNNYRDRANPADAKQMAVLAIVKEWVPHIPVGDTQVLVHAIRAAMNAYDQTLGGVQAQRRDDLDDSVEF